MAKVEVTKELLNKYKNHPRVLEIRLAVLFGILQHEYGYDGAMKLVSSICNSFNRNMDILNVILNKRFDIRRKSKTNRSLWIQEVVFMGLCYDETYYKIAKDYLLVTPSNFYRSNVTNNYNVSTFLTDEWLRNLDDEVKVTGSLVYRNEVKAFLETVDSLKRTLDKWNYNDKRSDK